MRRAHAIVRLSPSGASEVWLPTELHRIGKSEKFLEDAIAKTPKLLCLEARRFGLHGPFVAIQQASLNTATDRSVFPDVILLAESGHLIAVEVKRSINPELRTREVIAQILDYASSISRLGTNELCLLLDEKGVSGGDWLRFVQHCFPSSPNLDELASTFVDRIMAGHINIVIACDRIPPGTAETVASLSSLATIGFECDIVEIVPYVREEQPDTEVILVPTVRQATETVGRTIVQVIYQQEKERPRIEVKATSSQDIQRALGEIKSGVSRNWTEEEVAEQVERSNDLVLKELFLYAKARSENGRVVTDGVTAQACFGLYINAVGDSAPSKRQSLFSCQVDWRSVKIAFKTIDTVFGDQTAMEFRQRLNELLGGSIDCSKIAPEITTNRIAEKIVPFKATFDWLLSRPR